MTTGVYANIDERSIYVLDWNDMAARDYLMEDWAKYDEPLWGKNDDGESVAIHISWDNIMVETMQNNGWVRRNFYYYGEDMCEEIFAGRWM